MAHNAEILFERDDWLRPLTWSAVAHGLLISGIFVYAAIGQKPGAQWGGTAAGEAMGATLVSAAAVPLPANPVETQNVLANQSAGLSQSVPQTAEETPQAIPITEKEVKHKPLNHAAVEKEHSPPPKDNVIPFGEGGPVSGPYAIFNANNAKGGFSFSGGGNFGQQFGWYVDIVRRQVSENWMKYEVDPSITSARRVYLTFDILRDGSPLNVQIEQSSGVPSLDQSAVRSLQRIDSFGPLPPQYAGNKVSVEFWFDYKR